MNKTIRYFEFKFLFADFQFMLLWFHRFSHGTSVTKPLGRTKGQGKFMQYLRKLFQLAGLIS